MLKKKNKNKSNNFYSQNAPHYTNDNNYSNFNNLNNFNAHNQLYYSNDDYNYNTEGWFQNRYNNRNRQFPNDTYQYRTFDYTQHINYQNEYVNGGQRNENKYFSGINSRQYSQNQYATNSGSLQSEYEYGNEIPGAGMEEIDKNIDDMIETIMDGKDLDDVSEFDTERPSTRTVLKKSLLDESTFPTGFKKQKILTSYTDSFWKKGKDSDEPEEPFYQFKTGIAKKKKKPVKVPGLMKVNQFEKKVNEMLSAPVEMSKGKSLLEKMGWKGGGLGKDGDGILEPIAPKVTYATTTLGLGQLTEEDEDKPLLVNRVYFATLKCILEFVKNYLECELKFEASLSNYERKRIHQIAEALRNGTANKIPRVYRLLVKEIDHHNDYLLVTESTGEKKDRHLTLYKEAHDHMFLITPEDLEGEEEEITDDKDTNEPEQVYKNIKNRNESNEEIVDTSDMKNLNEENDAENKIIISSSKDTNSTQNHVDENQIKNDMISAMEEIKKNADFEVENSNIEVTNNIQNQLDNNQMETKGTNSITEDAYNMPHEKNIKQEKEIPIDIDKNVINSQTEESNKMENKIDIKKEEVLNANSNSRLAKMETGKKVSKTPNNKKGGHKDKPKNINDVLNIIIDHFIDYTEDPLYTELRFLGPFDHKERCAIDMFFEVCKKEHTIERSKEVLDLFDTEDFYLELKLDNNGRYVIHKIEKNMAGANAQVS